MFTFSNDLLTLNKRRHQPFLANTSERLKIDDALRLTDLGCSHLQTHPRREMTSILGKAHFPHWKDRRTSGDLSSSNFSRFANTSRLLPKKTIPGKPKTSEVGERQLRFGLLTFTDLLTSKKENNNSWQPRHLLAEGRHGTRQGQRLTKTDR